MKYDCIKIYPVLLALLITIFSSCDTDVDVKQDYDFEITMQKYRKEIKEGETKELEFFIKKEGNYERGEYFVSVFLRSGRGTITIGDEPLNENTFVKVNSSGFRLYYTSLSNETHQIEVIVKDSFGKEKETIVSLSNK